jgi:hypothetical protein
VYGAWTEGLAGRSGAIRRHPSSKTRWFGAVLLAAYSVSCFLNKESRFYLHGSAPCDQAGSYRTYIHRYIESAIRAINSSLETFIRLNHVLRVISRTGAAFETRQLKIFSSSIHGASASGSLLCPTRTRCVFDGVRFRSSQLI